MIDRYTRPEMGQIWDPAAQYASWLEVELAAAEAMAELGTIPQEVLPELRQAKPPDPTLWRASLSPRIVRSPSST